MCSKVIGRRDERAHEVPGEKTYVTLLVAAEDLGLDVEVTPQMPDGSPAPPGMTPPASMEVPVDPRPGDPASQPGDRVPTTIITADEAPPVCFIARVDWTRPVIEIQGGWT